MNVQQVFQLIFSFPFTILYGLAIAIINILYRTGVLKSVKFDVPIITVGNLSTGGTGKTPHVEYLIQLLRPYLNVATLSRGYKRNTKGFLEVAVQSNAEMVGDEPLQFKRKFEDVYVTVAESRTMAVSNIMMNAPQTQVILLDDGYQHRSLNASYHILLTTYDTPFFKDFLLPGGNLREWRAGYQRGNVVLVTKCPLNMTAENRTYFIEKIKPLPHQKVFFTYYEYGFPYYIFNPEQGVQLTDDLDVILVSGLANSDYLVKYMDEQVNFARILDFPDHHYFQEKDLINIKKQFDELNSKQKIILTTEKDATRLELHRNFLLQHQLPVFVLPIEVKFHFQEKEQFDETIKQFLLDFKV